MLLLLLRANSSPSDMGHNRLSRSPSRYLRLARRQLLIYRNDCIFCLQHSFALLFSHLVRSVGSGTVALYYFDAGAGWLNRILVLLQSELLTTPIKAFKWTMHFSTVNPPPPSLLIFVTNGPAVEHPVNAMANVINTK
jgi:hypothetical protein